MFPSMHLVVSLAVGQKVDGMMLKRKVDGHLWRSDCKNRTLTMLLFHVCLFVRCVFDFAFCGDNMNENVMESRPMVDITIKISTQGPANCANGARCPKRRERHCAVTETETNVGATRQQDVAGRKRSVGKELVHRSVSAQRSIDTSQAVAPI